MTEQELIKAGGNLWEKGAMRRVYFNAARFIEVDEENLSKKAAKRLKDELFYAKIWYDLVAGKWAANLFDDITKEVIEKVEQRVAEAAAEEPSQAAEPSQDKPEFIGTQKQIRRALEVIADAEDFLQPALEKATHADSVIALALASRFRPADKIDYARAMELTIEELNGGMKAMYAFEFFKQICARLHKDATDEDHILANREIMHMARLRRDGSYQKTFDSIALRSLRALLRISLIEFSLPFVPFSAYAHVGRAGIWTRFQGWGIQLGSYSKGSSAVKIFHKNGYIETLAHV